MAEAMEFDFSLPSNEGKEFDPELVEKVKKNPARSEWENADNGHSGRVQHTKLLC